ncbi:MAG TPA: anti-sigma factor antagonist [Sedimenticola thiotaurini]|uniref:Anti-sigma factor antagonist n=1 Tax=Sedimenticola thiotaurini TaxID=1543721 RepID=A0A831W9Q0_9GAMM|nr:anti-sigma factor antagonist [Sedimenticola thiotaurini]
MSITFTESDNRREVVIHVAGRFDFSCHQEFVRGYKEYPKGEKSFVVDLSSTEYMDSSAMGMLLQLREYAHRDGGVSLVNGREGVLEILRIANFDRLFRIA